MPMRRCIEPGCGKLYDKSEATGKRCPACQQTTDQTRDKRRGNTTQRGYGAAHQAERARQLADFTPGQPCARCGQPIASEDDADLGHDDHDRSRYRGLEHRRCNRGAARKPGWKGRRNTPQPAPCRPPADQDSEANDDDDDWCGIL